MVAATVFLNDHTALGAVLGVGSHVIGGAGVIAALLEPLLDGLAVRRRVVLHAAVEAELAATAIASHAQGLWSLLGQNHPVAVRVCARPQPRMRLQCVGKPTVN